MRGNCTHCTVWSRNMGLERSKEEEVGCFLDGMPEEYVQINIVEQSKK